MYFQGSEELKLRRTGCIMTHNLWQAAHLTRRASTSAISIDGNINEKTSSWATLPWRPLTDFRYNNDTVSFDIAHDFLLCLK